MNVLRNDRWPLLGLWALATLVNLFKPFHIDDGAHLIVAEWIARNPLHPMSGLLNWADSAEPIFVTNQPHFYFYLMAGVYALFGPSAIGMHLLNAAFSLWAIIAFHALVQRFVPQRALLLTFSFVISPGFLVNQNSMVDIPLVAMLITSVLFSTSTKPDGRSVWVSASCFSMGLLTKYTSVFLYPVLVWLAWVRRKPWAMLTPLLVLAAWSWFNITDIGAPHIFHRTTHPFDPFEAIKNFRVVFSTFAVFTFPAAMWLMVRGPARRWLMAAALATLVWFTRHVAGEPAVSLLTPINGVLVASVAVVGAAALHRVVTLIRMILRSTERPLQAVVARADEIALVLWLVGGLAFIGLFAPFQASRHALLLVPPLFILAFRNVAPSVLRSRFVQVGLVLWSGAALFVAANDWNFAAFYRDAAPRVAARAQALAGPSGKIFHRGHWGWQWYARSTGMREYDLDATMLRVGDLLVDPVGVHAQVVPGIEEFEVLDVDTERVGPFTIIDTTPMYTQDDWTEPLRLNPGRAIRILRRTQ